MVGHIYGKNNVLDEDINRQNMFLNEAKMYIDYYAKEIKKSLTDMTDKRLKYFNEFRQNMLDGIEYYKAMVPKMIRESQVYKVQAQAELAALKSRIDEISEQLDSVVTEQAVLA